MKNLKKIDIKEFMINPFDLKNKWMLISSTKEGQTNSMTASWGGLGVMWNKEVAFVVIRPQRFTKEFIDASGKFSLSFFDDKYKKDLAYLGKISGRDEKDKLLKTNLNPKVAINIPYFEEAEITIFANSLYKQPMHGKYLIDEEIDDRWYPEKDYHFLYIAEISTIYQRIK